MQCLNLSRRQEEPGIGPIQSQTLWPLYLAKLGTPTGSADRYGIWSGIVARPAL